MTKEQALQWEAKWARPAALAAFFAAVLLIARIVLLQTVIEDRADIEAIPDFLLSVDENPAMLIGSRAAQAVAALAGRRCLLLPLPRAPDPRGRSAVLVQVPDHPRPRALRDRARGRRARPASTSPPSSPTATPIRGRRRATTALSSCSRTTRAPACSRINFAGQVVTAFLFVMLPLRARRVGADEPVHGDPGRRRRRAARAPDRAGGPGDHPGVLAGRPRLADHRQLAGRSRPGLGERRGGALADPAAARRRGLLPRRATGRADRCSVPRTATSPSRCRSGPARASASATADYSPGRTSSTSPNSWRK